MHVRDLREESFSRPGLWLARTLAVVAVMALLPSLAYAQSSIAGIVRDASGAVRPASRLKPPARYSSRRCAPR